MLLLAPDHGGAASGFADDRDPSLWYYAPPELTVARDDAGKPAFLLLSYRDGAGEATGGILQFRLALAPLTAAQLDAAAARGQTARPLAFDGGRYRLRIRSLLDEADDQVEQWRPARFAGGELAAVTVALSPIEWGLLRPLLADGRAVVSVELELDYRGLVAGPPWLATANLAELHTRLAPLVAGLSSRDQIAAALLSLPAEPDLIAWQALAPGAAMPDRETLMRELARQARDELFKCLPGTTEEDARYTLRPDPADARCSWDLRIPRLERRTMRYTWSVTALPEFADPQGRQALFPSVGGLDLFGGAEVYLLNELPLDHNAVRQAWVDLRYPTAAGVFGTRRIPFSATTNTARIGVTFPALVADFQLDYRVGVMLAPAGETGWPQVIQGEFTTTTRPILRVGTANAGIDLVRVEAEPRVFASARAVVVELRNPAAQASQPPARIQLTAERPGTWLARPAGQLGDQLMARCVAFPPVGSDAEPLVLMDGPVSNRTVTILAAQLEAPGSERVTISLDPEAGAQLFYLAVELVQHPAPDPQTSGRQLTLDPGLPVFWYVQRRTVFAPTDLHYRLRYVARDERGQALPMTTSAWHPCTETNLVVRPTLPMLQEVAR